MGYIMILFAVDAQKIIVLLGVYEKGSIKILLWDFKETISLKQSMKIYLVNQDNYNEIMFWSKIISFNILLVFNEVIMT